MDATPTSRMCDWILNEIHLNKLNVGASVLETENLPSPTEITFDLNPSLESSIVKAEENFDALINTQELKVCHFEGYGKNTIKKLKLSPDAYAQMAIQLAYYKMNGVVHPTYESAQTKKYKYGRTETCRSVTMESVDWVKIMEDPLVSVYQKQKRLVLHFI